MSIQYNDHMHHKLIYGFALTEEEVANYKDRNLCKKYYLHTEGKPNKKKCVYGFHYGTVHNLHDKATFVNAGSIKLTNAEVPNLIIIKMSTLYRHRECKKYAIIQDVYTSENICGAFLYGYWLNNEIDKKLKRDLEYNMGELRIGGGPLREINIYDMTARCHNIKDYHGKYFMGYVVGDSYLPSVDNIEPDCNVLCERIESERKVPCDAMKFDVTKYLIKHYPETRLLDHVPVLIFKNFMCYCC
jgi:hypothetical protein